jgi:hypothetical protein
MVAWPCGGIVHHNGSIRQRPVHPMAAEKQREGKRGQGITIPFKGMLLVT